MNFIKRREASFDIAEYSIRVLGEPGIGKSSFFNSLFKEMERRKGKKDVGIFLALESGLKAMGGVPVLELPRKNGIGSSYLKDWHEVVEAIDLIVDAKKSDPNCPIEMVVFDTMSTMEVYGKARVQELQMEATGENKEFNACFSGYGAPHTILNNIVKNEIDKLKSVGITPNFIFHTKIKKGKSKLDNMEYTYVGSTTGEGFSQKIEADCDFSLMIVTDKKIISGSETIGERNIRLRNSDDFKGAKSRVQNVPDTFPCKPSADETVADFLKIVEDGLKKDNGVTEDCFKKIQSQQIHQNEVISKEKIKIEKTKDMTNEMSAKALALVDGIKSLKSFTNEQTKWLSDLDSKGGWEKVVASVGNEETINQIKAFFGV